MLHFVTYTWKIKSFCYERYAKNFSKQDSSYFISKRWPNKPDPKFLDKNSAMITTLQFVCFSDFKRFFSSHFDVKRYNFEAHRN